MLTKIILEDKRAHNPPEDKLAQLLNRVPVEKMAAILPNIFDLVAGCFPSGVHGNHLFAMLLEAVDIEHRLEDGTSLQIFGQRTSLTTPESFGKGIKPFVGISVDLSYYGHGPIHISFANLKLTVHRDGQNSFYYKPVIRKSLPPIFEGDEKEIHDISSKQLITKVLLNALDICKVQLIPDKPYANPNSKSQNLIISLELLFRSLEAKLISP